MRHVALGLLCLLLLSAFQTASALPRKSKEISSHRSGSGKGSHGIGGLHSSHDDKKNNDKPDDKKHGLGGLFGHDDKKNNDKPDDKKHGLGGLFGHDDQKKNDKMDSTLGPKKPKGHCKPKGKGDKGGKSSKGEKGQHPPRNLNDNAIEEDYADEENNLYARDDADELSCSDGIPSIARIKEEIRDKIVRDSCLFYAGPGGYTAKAAQWRNKPENRRYRILSMNWRDPKWPDQFKGADREVVDKRVSQAMAELCTGDVVVMLPSNTKGTHWKEGTVWDKYEWPNFSSAVTKVTRVNPDNDDEEVIWGN
ncbi:uncharacterized protein LDX57_009759 [Aspergillus melleus]|uniref:uncharacterized protein n=1 Tax=Aspergillus melleus TaxID=138277 RepID=UPI001E8D4E09|nr:uncharacterized protein LDX57_009759 [Aspergillus melleus]KAH8432113.1 hypothetical protein LDX57_009759 [Aspergillus melleus]